MTDRSVVVRLRAEVGSYLAAIGAAGASTRKLASDLGEAAAEGKKGTQELARGAVLTGGALLGMAAYAVKAFAEFDASMSSVKANASATNEEFGQLRQAALDAGNATKYSATEAADAENELAKAGLHAKEIIGALPGVLALAAAGQIGLTEATAITASTLKQFGLDASAAAHVADVLAAGADRSLADVTSLGEALKYAAPTADGFKVSLEETVGALAMFADQGMQGSIAGTTLNDVLLRVLPRSKKAGDAMDDLGLQFFNAKGEFIGIAGAAEELHTKLAGLTDAERLATLKTIFGVEGMRGAKYLFEQGAEGVNSYTKSVDAAGFAAKNAATKTDNLKGDVEKLTSAIQTGFIQAGSGADGVMRNLTQSATRLVDQFTSLPAGVQQSVLWVTVLSGSVIAAAGAYGMLVPKIAAARASLVALGPAGVRANTALGKVAKGAGVAAAAFIGMQIGAAVINSIRDNMIGAIPDVEQFTAAFRMLAETGDAGGLDKIGVSMDRLQESLRRLTRKSGEETFSDAMMSPFTAAFSMQARSLNQATKDFEKADQALAGMVTSGHAKEAAAAIEAIGMSAGQVRQALPGYTEAVQAASNAASDSAAGNKDGAAALGDVAKQAVEAAQAVKAYGDALRGMTPEGQMLQDTIAMNKALAEAKVQFREMGKAAFDSRGNLDLTTQSGQQAATTLIDIAQAAKSAAANLRDTGASEETANAKLESGRATFIALARSIGMSSDAANQLADDLGLIPPHTEATVTTPGVRPSTRDTKALNAEIRELHSKEVRLRVLGTPQAIAQANALRAAIAGVRSKNVTVSMYTRHVVLGKGNATGPNSTLGGILPGRASGGSVTRSKPYWVGEDGPELMFPQHDGTIIPNRPSEDIVRRFAGTASWQGGGMSASPSSSTAGGPVELGPRSIASLADALGRQVSGGGGDVVVQIGDETVARANNRGQRSLARRS